MTLPADTAVIVIIFGMADDRSPLTAGLLTQECRVKGAQFGGISAALTAAAETFKVGQISLAVLGRI